MSNDRNHESRTCSIWRHQLLVTSDTNQHCYDAMGAHDAVRQTWYHEAVAGCHKLLLKLLMLLSLGLKQTSLACRGKVARSLLGS